MGLAGPPRLPMAKSKEGHWVPIPAPPSLAVRPLARYLPSLNLFPHLQTGEAMLTHATDVGHSVFSHQIFAKPITLGAGTE